jgi:hypothetical protein
METREVRKRLQHEMRLAGQRAADRRARVSDAEQAYAVFLQRVAVPLATQLVDAMRAEGIAVTLSTPKDSVRLTLDRGRDNYVEIALDATDEPRVVARTSRAHGTQTRTDEQPITPGAGSGEVTEEELLEFLMGALAPWLGR